MKKICFRSILTVFLFLLACQAEAKNTHLYIEDFTIEAGESKEIKLMFEGDVYITQVQFTITLPEGMEFENKGTERRPVYASNTSNSAGLQLSANMIAAERQLIVFMSDGEQIGTEKMNGELAVIYIKASKDMNAGDYTLTLSDMEASDENAVPYVTANTDVNVTVTKQAKECTVDIQSGNSEYGTVSVSPDNGGKYEEGTQITVTATPNEGYHFVQWSDGTTDNPYVLTVGDDIQLSAEFAPNQYTVTFVFDNGEEDLVTTQDYKSKITKPADPTKTGFTFKGWSPAVAATVPASDVTYTAQWERNSYKLTYVVDGETVKEVTVSYEAAITPEAEPEKEGYTFSGWSEIPETMPAHDVTVTGTFTVNKYKLTYMIDGEVYKTVEVEYGATVTAEPAPDGDYATFEWTDLPETMPAHDVTVSATYTTGIGAFTLSRPADVYTVTGSKVRTNTTSLKGLPRGVYVVNGRKVIVGN